MAEDAYGYKEYPEDDVAIIPLLDSVNVSILFAIFHNSFARCYHQGKMVKEDKVSCSVVHLTAEDIVGYIVISRQKIFNTSYILKGMLYKKKQRKR